MKDRIRQQIGPASTVGLIVALLALAAGQLAGAAALVAVVLIGAALSALVTHSRRGSTLTRPKARQRSADA